MSKSPAAAVLDSEEQEFATQIHGHHVRALIVRVFQHRAALALGCATILVGTAATLLEPRIFGYAIDEAIVPGKWAVLRSCAAVYLGVTVVRVLSLISQAYFFELLGQRVTQDIRLELFSHLQRLPVSVFDRNPAGRLLTRVTNDTASLADMFAGGFVSMVGNALMVFGILIGLLLLDLRLGLISVAIFPVMIGVCVHFSERLRVAYREARSRLSALNAFLAENLMGMKVVNLFNRQGEHQKRFEKVNQWYAEAQTGTVRVFAYFQPAISWASGIAMALLIWYGGIATRSGAIKLGVLVAFFSYVLSLFQPMREIADKWNVFLSGMASAERIFSILSWPVEMPASAVESPADRLADVRGHLVFENVWFAYEAERWVLKDFSLEIPAGDRVGIVGHTGSGKTTLISLLLRLYDPQKGRILLDGRDLREYDLRSLREIFGMVQQDVFLFSGTSRHNITFWEKESNGQPPSDTLFERGANLSMGQRQMLAFDRAVYSKPRVWILDEATANMDSESEQKLSLSLTEASRGATTLMIAHRLATVQDADQIIVLNKGACIERGTHDELARLGGLYSRLFEYQRAADQRLSSPLPSQTV